MLLFKNLDYPTKPDANKLALHYVETSSLFLDVRKKSDMSDRQNTSLLL